MRKDRIRRIALLCLLAGVLLTGCTVKREASQWQVHHDQAMDELRDGYYDEAIANFTAAIEADPIRPESYVGRGQAYLTYPAYLADSNDGAYYMEKAQADFEQALKLDKGNVDAWLGLTDLCLVQNDFPGAVDTLKEALDATGMDETILQQLNEIEGMLEGNRRVEEAFETFLAEKGYLSYLDEWYYEQPKEYAMVELNWDGQDELLITGGGDMGFFNFAVFVYDEDRDAVVPAEIENNVMESQYVGQYYASILYSAENRALVYRELNNGMFFDSVTFSGLKDPATLTTLFALSFETDGQTEEKHYSKYMDGQSQSITEEAFERSIDEAAAIDFTPLP